MREQEMAEVWWWLLGLDTSTPRSLRGHVFKRLFTGHGPVADKAQNVVVDGPLVRANDDRERPLVAALGFPEDPEIRLFERQCAASIAPLSASLPTFYDLLKCHRFPPPG